MVCSTTPSKRSPTKSKVSPWSVERATRESGRTLCVTAIAQVTRPSGDVARSLMLRDSRSGWRRNEHPSRVLNRPLSRATSSVPLAVYVRGGS